MRLQITKQSPSLSLDSLYFQPESNCPQCVSSGTEVNGLNGCARYDSPVAFAPLACWRCWRLFRRPLLAHWGIWRTMTFDPASENGMQHRVGNRACTLAFGIEGMECAVRGSRLEMSVRV